MRMNQMFRLALGSIVATGLASAAFADDDVRSTDTTEPAAVRSTDTPEPATVPSTDTTTSTTPTPLTFDAFDQRWCVGDGPTPLACDVRVVPPGPDAFTMFGETWCLNDAPGRTCDVRVRGDGIPDDEDDEG